MRKVILLLGLVLQVIIVDTQSVSGSLVDEKGNIIKIDHYIIIILRNIINKIDNKKIIYDVKCSKSLEDEIPFKRVMFNKQLLQFLLYEAKPSLEKEGQNSNTTPSDQG